MIVVRISAAELISLKDFSVRSLSEAILQKLLDAGIPMQGDGGALPKRGTIFAQECAVTGDIIFKWEDDHARDLQQPAA